MNLFGSSSGVNSSNSQNTSIAFNPVINTGGTFDGNIKGDNLGIADSYATSTAKDELGISAGVAIGDGASASGGPVGVGDKIEDSQPMQAYPGVSGIIDKLKTNAPLISVLVVSGLAVAVVASRRKGSK